MSRADADANLSAFMRRPRAAFSRARATAEPSTDPGQTAPPSDGGRTPDPAGARAASGRAPAPPPWAGGRPPDPAGARAAAGRAPARHSWAGLALSLGILALIVVVGFYLR